MPDLMNDFQEVIPGAAQHANNFLNIVLERGNEAQLGLVFEPKQNRKTGAYTLEAKITFRKMVSSGKPQIVVVFAEPMAQMLSVGWQLTQQGDSWLSQISENAAYKDAKRAMINQRPENVRAMQGMLLGFHQGVFLPTMHQLAEATMGQQRQNSSGFLGA